jgi:META domain
VAPVSVRFLVVVTCWALVGCGIVPSAYRVKLSNTSWTVTALDGKSLVGGPTMTFNENGVDGVVTVRTTCGSTQMGIDQDTDGDAITFWNLAPRASACSGTELAADAPFFDALEAVQTWQVDDGNHIRLIGPKEIVATR